MTKPYYWEENSVHTSFTLKYIKKIVMAFDSPNKHSLELVVGSITTLLKRYIQ